jgi:hypothetical protein
MLWRTSDLGRLRLEATDGAIGAIVDTLFDEASWTVRWLVVDTGSWLPGRKVLLAPGETRLSDDHAALRLGLTRQAVRDAPPLASEAPVSRHYETRLAAHYGWTEYWTGPPLAALPVPELPEPPEEPAPDEPPEAPPLRSTGDMTGCHIHARDGTIGHIDDVLVDPATWRIRYVVVDTGNFWPGKQVLVVPRALTGIDWVERTAEVDLTRDQVRNGPAFEPGQILDLDFEARYRAYYGYPLDW